MSKYNYIKKCCSNITLLNLINSRMVPDKNEEPNEKCMIDKTEKVIL